MPQLSPAELPQVDAELGQVIEQVEAKYGFRPGQPASAGTAVAPGTAVDSEMIREIESYYQAKRLRDLSRQRTGQGGHGEEGERRGSKDRSSSTGQESGKTGGE
jgi:hypothetical protein